MYIDCCGNFTDTLTIVHYLCTIHVIATLVIM